MNSFRQFLRQVHWLGKLKIDRNESTYIRIGHIAKKYKFCLYIKNIFFKLKRLLKYPKYVENSAPWEA